MEDFYANLGKSIRTIRERSGITQAELSECAEISQNFISQLESGKKKPSLDTLIKIAGCMNVPVETIFSVKHSSKQSYDKVSDERLKVLIKRLKEHDREFIIDLLSRFETHMKKR